MVQIQKRILIVDDHPLVRRGLVDLVSAEDTLQVCGEAGSVEEGIAAAKELEPDLVIVDISLAGASGLDLIKKLKAWKSDLKILVSSMHDEQLFAERCLRAGAQGYVNKEEATERVVEAVTSVLGGDVYLSGEMTRRLLAGLASGNFGEDPVSKLSNRELEVFELIGRGNSTREIAKRLHLSIKTVESHRDKVKAKLDLNSSAELTRHAVQWVLEYR